MGKNIKKTYTKAFKLRVALELIRGSDTVAAICSRYSLHPTQARRWKDQALVSMETGFSQNQGKELKEKDKLIEELYKQVGQLKVELDWLKKNMGLR